MAAALARDAPHVGGRPPVARVWHLGLPQRRSVTDAVVPIDDLPPGPRHLAPNTIRTTSGMSRKFEMLVTPAPTQRQVFELLGTSVLLTPTQPEQLAPVSPFSLVAAVLSTAQGYLVTRTAMCHLQPTLLLNRAQRCVLGGASARSAHLIP